MQMREPHSHFVSEQRDPNGAYVRGTSVERKLVALFLFFVPFQVRVLLSEFGAGVQGSEWSSAWLWASDVAFMLLLTFWFLSGMRRRDLFPLLFLLFFLPSFIAHPSQAGAFTLVKVAEGLLVFSYARTHREWLLTSQHWPYAFVVGLAINAIVGIAQFAIQRDLGLQFLDESPLDPSAPGVAKFHAGSGVLLRAYGLTPHPNILGAMLLSGIAIVTFLYIYRGVRWLGRYSIKRQREELVRGTLLFLFLFGMFFTFSRLAWLATFIFLFLVLAAIAFRKSLRTPYQFEAIRYTLLLVAILFMLVSGFGTLFRWRATIMPQEEAVVLRQFYGTEAVKMIEAHPYLGVGPGRFVAELSARNPGMPAWQAQPVHNVVLLLFAENGIPATFFMLAAFIFVVLATWRRVVSMHDPGIQLVSLCLLAYVTSLLLLSSFDHFLWTSQQGRMILWFTLGLLAA